MTKTEKLKIESCDNGYIVTMGLNGAKSVAKSKGEVCTIIAECLKSIIPNEKDIDNIITLDISLTK